MSSPKALESPSVIGLAPKFTASVWMLFLLALRTLTLPPSAAPTSTLYSVPGTMSAPPSLNTPHRSEALVVSCQTPGTNVVVDAVVHLGDLQNLVGFVVGRGAVDEQGVT